MNEPMPTATASWSPPFDGNFPDTIVGTGHRDPLNNGLGGNRELPSEIRILNTFSSDIYVERFDHEPGSVFRTSCTGPKKLCGEEYYERFLAPGELGIMGVTFWPEAVGANTGTVTATYCSPTVISSPGYECGANGQNVTVNPSGTGIAQTRIISVLKVLTTDNPDGNLDFGEVAIGDEKTLPFKIRNSGNYPLTYSGLTAALEAIAPPTSAHSQYGYSFVPSANTGTIASGEITLTVTFYSQVEETYSDTLTVPSDATSVDGTASIAVSATGVLP